MGISLCITLTAWGAFCDVRGREIVRDGEIFVLTARFMLSFHSAKIGAILDFQ
jgi:hypothetical protein